MTLLLLSVGLGAAATPYASTISLAAVFPESQHYFVKCWSEQGKTWQYRNKSKKLFFSFMYC